MEITISYCVNDNDNELDIKVDNAQRLRTTIEIIRSSEKNIFGNQAVKKLIKDSDGRQMDIEKNYSEQRVASGERIICFL